MDMVPTTLILSTAHIHTGISILSLLFGVNLREVSGYPDNIRWHCMEAAGNVNLDISCPVHLNSSSIAREARGAVSQHVEACA